MAAHNETGYVRGLVLQKIVSRSFALAAYQVQPRLNGVADDQTRRMLERLSPALLDACAGESLLRLHALCRQQPVISAGSAIRLLLGLEKSSLANPALVDRALETAAHLRGTGYQLAIQPGNRPLEHGAARRAYVEGLIHLQNAGIAVVLADPPLQAGASFEIELGLCDLARLDLATLGVPLVASDGYVHERHARLRDALFAFAERERLPLIAGAVNSRWQHQVASGLPFALLQGDFYGAAVAMGRNAAKTTADGMTIRMPSTYRNGLAGLVADQPERHDLYHIKG